MATGGGIILFFLILALAFRLLAGNMDHDRIRSEVEGRGGKVRSITWQPFGKGWFGEKNDRIYQVVYEDSGGLERTAWCKTSMMSGVYFSEDQPPRLPEHAVPTVDQAEPAEAADAGRGPERPGPGDPFDAIQPDAETAEEGSAALAAEIEALRAENEELRRRLGER